MTAEVLERGMHRLGVFIGGLTVLAWFGLLFRGDLNELGNLLYRAEIPPPVAWLTALALAPAACYIASYRAVQAVNWTIQGFIPESTTK